MVLIIAICENMRIFEVKFAYNWVIFCFLYTHDQFEGYIQKSILKTYILLAFDPTQSVVEIGGIFDFVHYDTFLLEPDFENVHFLFLRFTLRVIIYKPIDIFKSILTKTLFSFHFV